MCTRFHFTKSQFFKHVCHNLFNEDSPNGRTLLHMGGCKDNKYCEKASSFEGNRFVLWPRNNFDNKSNRKKILHQSFQNIDMAHYQQIC